MARPAPAMVARAIVEATTPGATTAEVASRYGVTDRTIRTWVSTGPDDPEVRAALAIEHRALATRWRTTQAQALAAGWSMLASVSARIAAIVDRGPDEDDVPVLLALGKIVDQAGGTLGGIDYAQRRAGTTEGEAAASSAPIAADASAREGVQ
jgi:hypothetical protein